MRSRLLTPRWLGLHLVAVLAVAFCLTGGYWQFQRAQEPDRAEVNNPAAELETAQPLGEISEPGAYMPESDGNTAVTVEGTYADTPPLLAPGHNTDGEFGYFVIAPLLTGEEADGAEPSAVVVNQGWITEDDADKVSAADSPDTALPPTPQGPVTVTGWLQPPQKDEDGVAPMGLPDDRVARIAPALLVNDWPYQLYEGFVVLGDQQPSTANTETTAVEMLPAPPPEPEPGITWNWTNVSYAAQWVVFSGAVVVFWVSLVRREIHDTSSAHQEPQADPTEGTPGPDDAGRGGPGQPVG